VIWAMEAIRAPAVSARVRESPAGVAVSLTRAARARGVVTVIAEKLNGRRGRAGAVPDSRPASGGCSAQSSSAGWMAYWSVAVSGLSSMSA
jgi:hypothetical protein